MSDRGMLAFGVDIGFRRVSIAALDEAGDFAVRSATVPGPDEIAQAKTFRWLYLAARTSARALVLAVGEPITIMVERPAGRVVSPEMHYSFALISAALESLDVGLVASVVPGRWKKLALGDGFGGADKSTVMTWARQQGYRGSSQDEADALGIAAAALKLTRVVPEPDQLTLDDAPLDGSVT